ncbi:cytochrome B [Thioclava sp. SK-1]|uniref:cytochrome b/b6 domain-containing protein n=1 Tax=Thioclava sp. SK-1 TaxID=1889770 RepID=UPI000824B8B8|nr:cytochrome b/b6 domain-containing protein [Thioclava sp. SK-1]OCX61083.1 cytochrome B [Thioclava sp. SK-1]
MTDSTAKPAKTIRLWDPLLRIFHWSLVVFVCSAWGLGQWGPDVMTLHFWAGYIVGGLLVFRWIWGLVGPKTARFSQFLQGPAAVVGYVSHMFARRPSNWYGHNPLGGWMVLIMLLLLSVQVLTGLTSDPDDFINIGPWAQYVGYEASVTALDIHEAVATLILIVVIAHVAAILFYAFWKREDLVRPMVTGRKKIDDV